MINLQSILLRFAEPFMDSKYSKVSLFSRDGGSHEPNGTSQMDKIDPLYLAHSHRIDVKEETRIKATSDEALEWQNKVHASGSESLSLKVSLLAIN